MVNLIIDMGTSNTRLYRIEDGVKTSEAAVAFGARATAEQGQAAMYALLHKKIEEVMQGCSEPLEAIFVYGMGGSEYGIALTERIKAPVTAQEISKNLNQVNIPELWNAPVYVIPGVFCQNTDDGITEIMRGEETETVGFLAQNKITEKSLLILPGSHCKTIRLGADGSIEYFSSAMTGEMLQSMAENTILKTAVDLKVEPDVAFLIKGAEAARKTGMNNALLQVRTMQCAETYSVTQMSSFFMGAVLYPEINYIVSHAATETVYVGGKVSLQTIYCTLLDFYGTKKAVAVENAAGLGLCGALEILRLRRKSAEKAQLIENIKANKIIAIIRGLKKEDYLPTVEALYNGGIRLAEITFDATGKRSDEETAEIIGMLSEHFKGKMQIGAGTVLKPSQVCLTAEHGGKYIISPNFDADVIRETNRLSLVSIPGCFSPSEAVNAYNVGADFIKIFPNDLGLEKYIKALHAPLAHIPFMAVGGINEDNLAAMLKAGAVGVGIGSLLIDKKLIGEKNFAGITKKAENCVKSADC